MYGGCKTSAFKRNVVFWSIVFEGDWSSWDLETTWGWPDHDHKAACLQSRTLAGKSTIRLQTVSGR
jgi:hypothetical protein